MGVIEASATAPASSSLNAFNSVRFDIEDIYCQNNSARLLSFKKNVFTAGFALQYAGSGERSSQSRMNFRRSSICRNVIHLVLLIIRAYHHTRIPCPHRRSGVGCWSQVVHKCSICVPTHCRFQKFKRAGQTACSSRGNFFVSVRDRQNFLL